MITATLIKMPESKQEVIWTNPEHVVDDRGLVERLFNINTHKIRKQENRGQQFRGRVSFTEGIFKFDTPVVMNKKIKEVRAGVLLFQGVIPVDECAEGTICKVDCYKTNRG